MCRNFLFYMTVMLISCILTLSSLAVDNIKVIANNKNFNQQALGTDAYTPNPFLCGIGYHQTGQVDASFNCYGQFGTGFYSGSGVFPSFISPSDSRKEYLFGGAVWVGAIVGQDTLVSIGADGWQNCWEMFPTTYPTPTVTSFRYTSNYAMRAEYCDTFTSGVPNLANDIIDGRSHKPLNIKVINRSHSWQSDPENNIIIYDMIITNIGHHNIEQGYLGLYFDADVLVINSQGFGDDITGFLSDVNVAYIIDNDGNPVGGSFIEDSSLVRPFAFKYLKSSADIGNVNFNWWISNGNPALDFGPRRKDNYRDFGTGGVGTPEGDRNKYFIMSNGEWDYDQIYTASITADDPVWELPPTGIAQDLSNGYDTRFLYSFGPFDLEPGNSHRIIFATFTGDSVHIDPYNYTNNMVSNYDPASFLANLNFDRVRANAAVADSLAETLTDPDNPPQGLHLINKSGHSFTVGWDPWVFDNYDGFELYLSEIPEDSIYYPGLVPPWLKPETLMPYASYDGDIDSYTFNDINPFGAYFVNIAHNNEGLIGLAAGPLIVGGDYRPEQPYFTHASSGYIFVYNDHVQLEFSSPLSYYGEIEHFNIYKFPVNAQGNYDIRPYLPFYDTGENRYYSNYQVQDSFFVDDKIYYYYAMEPYAQVEYTFFNDYTFNENDKYIVTYVDSSGVESYLSFPVIVKLATIPTKDILVITKTKPTGQLVIFDTVSSFYDSVLYEYSHDLYYLYDSIGSYPDSFDWHVLTNYKTVILDDGMQNGFPFTNTTFQEAFRVYLAWGGQLVHFGAFSSATGFSGNTTASLFYNQVFGVSSYYKTLIFPLDSAFAFLWSESRRECLPNLHYDTTRQAISTQIYNSPFNWPLNVVPCVTSFEPDYSQKVFELYTYRAAFPSKSPLEGHLTGVINYYLGGITLTYAFGFHLWYMEYDAARELINSIMSPPYECYRNVQYVATDGDDLNGVGSYSNPYATIQKAVDKAENYDTVMVMDGIFTGQGNRDILIHDKILYITSTNGPEYTVIDCGGSASEPHRAFHYNSPFSYSAWSDLKGFTIKNGYGLDDEGTGFSYGGAIRCDSGATPYFVHCLFINNYADSGSSAYFDSLSEPGFSQCTFVNNISGTGGGVVVFDSAAYFINCIIAYNNGTSLECREQSALTSIYQCNFYNNSNGDWVGCIANNLGTNHNNFNVNPFFCDTASGDYHLVSGSPLSSDNWGYNWYMGAFDVDSNCTNTSPGSDITLDLSSHINITFENINNTGVTGISIDYDGPELPFGYTVIPQNQPAFYSITTTAGYSGDIEICITYNDSDIVGSENNIALLHYDGVYWNDITTFRNTLENRICGTTTFLSPFTLVDMDCCHGITGNSDCSESEDPDISDISTIICFLYLHCNTLCCPDEADVDGSGRPFGVSGGDPDITDVIRLIDYLYLSHTPLPSCP